jgi:DNA (cytosine-5)-methyltransferase 1
MNYIDLFSGIGGFALGAYWAGMKFDKHYFSEIDPYCVELYQKRFPEAIPLGDITKHEEWDLEDGEYIFTGGFPCTDISMAGKKAGIEGEQSGLWKSYAELIRKIRPTYIIVENVAAILIRGIDVVIGDLAEIGYFASWDCIPAAAIGAHFVGDRIWIIASRSETRRCRWERSWPATVGKNQWGRDKFERLVRMEVEHGVPAGSLGRVSDGVPNRIHRLRGLGNAIVPQIAELLFRQILELT